MRPQSFYNQMPQGRPFNTYPGPSPGRGPGPGRAPGPGPGQMQNFGFQPPNSFQSGMMPPSGPGMPRNSGPKLDSFMDTANKFLATAQSFQPLIQQASPMIRNLPALWKLYKGFQGLPKANETEDQPRQDKRGDQGRREKQSRRESFDTFETPSQMPRRTDDLTMKPSTPRIFQPPYNFD